MDRRKVLLGSGAALASVLAGCSSTSSPKTGARDDTDDKNDTNEKSGEKEDENEKSDGKEDENGKNDIPGFDRDDFHIDSDAIQVKEITYHDQRLDVHLLVTTNDRDELVEELRALAPGLARGVRDTEEFLAGLEEIEFTLFDENKNRVFAFFLDVTWLREFLDGDITNDELVDRILDSLE